MLQHQKQFPELENYLGFVGTDGDDVVMEDENGAGEAIPISGSQICDSNSGCCVMTDTTLVLRVCLFPAAS